MNFAQIVRSPPSVRHAFENSPVHAAWWRWILMLHGKPAEPDSSTQNTNAVLADGFRFYGYLYVVLAFVLLVVSTLVGFIDSTSGYFWICLALSSAFYLVCASQLAFAGARCYPCKPREAIPLLVAFFVSIIAWLTAFLSGGLIVVHFLMPESELFAIIATATLMIFGVGSYFIELVFLTTRCSE